ncbi:hypothetical protein M595_6177 [Lyngbya aestuarii BL J]|uniref:Uncharacterized protein n=1 Tax=Lyngbya aestuarii BL J TaxID=1348334 RepID=U7Q9P4_9CYAN|nr:hypothetical protein M595_6177 [Lyngbya aestuarii BL J]
MLQQRYAIAFNPSCEHTESDRQVFLNLKFRELIQTLS